MQESLAKYRWLLARAPPLLRKLCADDESGEEPLFATEVGSQSRHVASESLPSPRNDYA